MKIWNGANTVILDKYSIAENLLFSIVAETPNRELLPFEKLFIVFNSGILCHAGYLTDIYMDCGCFAKAKEAYVAAGHTRKIGDICWIQGDLEEAEQHYLNPISKAQSYRTLPDYDRLIKLAFVREYWNDVVRFFVDARFRFGVTTGCVLCGSSETSARPFLEMLAIALTALNIEPSVEVLSILKSAFFLSQEQWHEFQQNPQFNEAKTIQKIKRRCPPAQWRNPKMTVEDALSQGNTPRANDILSYIKQCDRLVCEAQEHLEQFRHIGNESDLNRFVEIVTYSGITSVSQSFLFSATGHNSFATANIHPERLLKFYNAHPVMNKQYYGELLKFKFDNHLNLSGIEILTGLFQQIGSINAIVEPDSIQNYFDFNKLVDFQDWAELCLDDWISGPGSDLLDDVSRIWREGQAKYVQQPFGARDLKKPATPRNMIEWNDLLNISAKWLKQQWQREIGQTAWVSENQLFQLLKRQLKGMDVQQHAQPTWILPQHLDIYIPEVSIAIEYMGAQHYRPIDFFGGESGFVMIQERDRKKLQKCQDQNIKLYFVKYDEDVGERVKVIVSSIKNNTY